MLRSDQKLLEVAAGETMRRIRADRREKATARVRPLVLHIEDHLFDLQLNVAMLMQECEVRDHSVAVLFNRDLGESPAAYIRQRRLEVASRLLVDTEMKIWKIAHLVGYSSAGVFGESFKEWTGLPPTAYRKAARKSAVEAESHGRRLQEIGRRFIEGQAYELELEELDFLHLWVTAQRQEKAPRSQKKLTLDGADVERGLALTHWEKLRNLPPREQEELVRQPYAPTTTALFDVLREKSREEGRKDRQEGVRIAELALASLDGIAAHLTPQELANRKAQGMAWLGNAQRLALDFPEAGRTFTKARGLLPEDPDLAVVAEIYNLQGELFLFQSKFEEALELKNRAVELFRSLGRNQSLAESLLSRGAAIGYCRGFEAAIPDFLDAMKVAELVSDAYLTACAHEGLVGAYAFSGQTEEALRGLSAARGYCARAGDPTVTYQLQWVEAFIAQQQGKLEFAEERLLAARSGFVATGESLLASTVELDLAEFCLTQERDSEAVNYALGAVPIFEQFGNHPEAVAALALLSNIAGEREINVKLIQAVRSYLAQLAQHPMGFRNGGSDSSDPPDGSYGTSPVGLQ